MGLLLQISDTHFGTEQPHVVEALKAFARERQPDVLVYSGDMTQRALRPEFAAARRLADDLAVPRMLALPGNHDIPLFHVVERLVKPYARYLEAFGPRLEPVLESDDFLVIGVNTTRPLLHKDGDVSARQVARVCQQLRAARPGQLRVVVTHQPADVVREKDAKDRLRDAEPALHAWSAAGADLVLGGHIHLPYVKDLAARPTPTPRRMWCIQAGTAVSNRLRHGTCNSVNLVHWHAARRGEPRACRIERCDYSPEDGVFRPVESRDLALDAPPRS